MAHAPDTAGLARATNVWAAVGPSETARSFGLDCAVLGRCSSGPKQMLWSSEVYLDSLVNVAHAQVDLR
jgi:hypothetical protein